MTQEENYYSVQSEEAYFYQPLFYFAAILSITFNIKSFTMKKDSKKD